MPFITCPSCNNWEELKLKFDAIQWEDSNQLELDKNYCTVECQQCRESHRLNDCFKSGIPEDITRYLYVS